MSGQPAKIGTLTNRIIPNLFLLAIFFKNHTSSHTLREKESARCQVGRGKASLGWGAAETEICWDVCGVLPCILWIAPDNQLGDVVSSKKQLVGAISFVLEWYDMCRDDRPQEGKLVWKYLGLRRAKHPFLLESDRHCGSSLNSTDKGLGTWDLKNLLSAMWELEIVQRGREGNNGEERLGLSQGFQPHRQELEDLFFPFLYMQTPNSVEWAVPLSTRFNLGFQRPSLVFLVFWPLFTSSSLGPLGSPFYFYHRGQAGATQSWRGSPNSQWWVSLGSGSLGVWVESGVGKFPSVSWALTDLWSAIKLAHSDS